MDMKSEIKIKDEEIEYYSYDHDPQVFSNSDSNFATTSSIKIDEPFETVYIKSELKEIEEDSMLDEEQVNCDMKPEMMGRIFIDVDAQGEDSKVESSESRSLTSGTVDEATKKNSQNYFRCRFCNLTFEHLDELGNHLKTHEKKKFKCDQCSYECNFKSNLKSHLLIHSNLKLFKCTECSYECNQRNGLTSHLLTHSNLKSFKCSECTYESNRKDGLKLHLLTHSNLKLFKCSECTYECKHKGQLKRHLLTHSNLKLFMCSECPYKCNQKVDLKLHLLAHSNLKLFKCSECNYECNRKGDLKKHILRKHEIGTRN